MGITVPVVLVLLFAAPAHAADRIYWSNYDGNSIAYANLNGDGGGGTVDTGGATVAGPMGLALDPSRGRIYWANWNGDAGTTISYADLDGGGGGDLDIQGATVAGPHGLAIDPSIGPGGRLYWANYADNSIAYADLDGTGGGTGADLAIKKATVDGPRGITVDPVTGRLYWSNFSGGDGTTISFADLDGRRDGDLLHVGSTGEGPEGTAIDSVSGKIYWSDYGAWTQLAYANVDGSDVLAFDGTPATQVGVHGVAIEPFTRRIYWANYGTNSISSASLAGGGGEDLDTSGASVNGPNLPALLEEPEAVGAPWVIGGSEPGANLRCSESWRGDVLESLLYRAPSDIHYRWTLDGEIVADGDARKIDAAGEGNYRCQVTARNAAGSTVVRSAAHRVAQAPPSNAFEFGELRRNRRNGTASETIVLPGPGIVSVAGKRVRALSRSPDRARPVNLPIEPRGHAQRSLDRRGTVVVHPTFTFTPTGGRPRAADRRIKLVERLRRQSAG